jgi:hypothetical protein
MHAMTEVAYRNEATTGRSHPRRAGAGRFVTFLLLSLVGTPTTAHAYLDPGTAGIALQMILGGAAGVAVVVKLYWRSVVRWVKGKGPTASTRRDL